MSTQTRQTIGFVLSGAVLIAALAGLVVAIQNLQRSGVDCTTRSMSIAYIVLFVIAVLAAFGLGGAVFKGTELGASAGGTILAFSSFALFAISAGLALNAGKIADKGPRDANYAVFGIIALLTIINAGYLFSQRRSIVGSQPVNDVLDYVQNRFGNNATRRSART
jgi:hypothetical protein